MPRKSYRKRRTRRPRSKKTTIKKIVRRELRKNIEMKFRQYKMDAVGHSITGGAAVDFTAGFEYGASTALASLCDIANGTGEGQRIGGQIRVKGIHLRFAFQPGDWYNNVRFIVYSPKKNWTNSSVTAAVQQVLSDVSSASTQWSAPVDTENFKVYMDKVYNARFLPTGDATTTSVAQTKFVNKFIKLNKLIKWDVSAPVMPTSNIFLMAISDSSTAVNGDPKVITGFIKVFYQDA